jgi:hypothetical protein
LDDLTVVSIVSGTNRRLVLCDVSIGSGVNFAGRFGASFSFPAVSLEDLAEVSMGSTAKRRLVLVVVSTGWGAKREGSDSSTCSRISFEDFVVVSMGSTWNRLGAMVVAIFEKRIVGSSFSLWSCYSAWIILWYR